MYSLLVVIHIYTLSFHMFPSHMLIPCVLLLFVYLLLCPDMIGKTHSVLWSWNTKTSFNKGRADNVGHSLLGEKCLFFSKKTGFS